MITFKATEQQVLQIAVNAVNASMPMGLGMFHYELKDYTTEDLRIERDGIDIDYFGGRMVKLTIKRKKENWEVVTGKPIPDDEYQSWADIYPSYAALLNSVAGVEILETSFELNEELE